MSSVANSVERKSVPSDFAKNIVAPAVELVVNSIALGSIKDGAIVFIADKAFSFCVEPFQLQAKTNDDEKALKHKLIASMGVSTVVFALSYFTASKLGVEHSSLGKVGMIAGGMVAKIAIVAAVPGLSHKPKKA